MTLTTIATGITSMVFLLSGLKVYSVYKRDESPFALFLSGFFFFFFLQQLFFFMGTGLLTDDPGINSVLWAAAHLFMFAGISIFIRLPFRIKFPELERVGFGIAVAYSILGSIFLLYRSSDVVPRVLENNVFFFEVPAAAGAVIGIFTSISLIFALYVFISELFQIKDKRESRTKLILLSLGTVFFLIGGPIHNFVDGPMMLVIADSLIVLGALTLLAGVEVGKILKLLKLAS